MPRRRSDRRDIAKVNHMRVKYARLARQREARERAKREPRPAPVLTELGNGPSRCWCGNLFGHEWAGKDEGAPHPR